MLLPGGLYIYYMNTSISTSTGNPFLDRYPVVTQKMTIEELCDEATRLELLRLDTPLDRLDSARLDFVRFELRNRGAI